MFKDRSFNLALAISLAGHLFLILAVTIVILPVEMDSAVYSPVSFLGPILEKTAFDILFEERSKISRTRYGDDGGGDSQGASLVIPPLSKVPVVRQYRQVPPKENFLLTLKRFFIGFKKTPKYKLKGQKVGISPDAYTIKAPKLKFPNR